MTEQLFADLHAELRNLPDLAIVAVGGLPIVRVGSGYHLVNSPIDYESLRTQLMMGLGLGAVLTHQNPKGKTLIQLGHLCLNNRHLWTAHILHLTLVFSRCPVDLRNALAFDRRFHLSWIENEVRSVVCTFTATGSLREWSRLIGYVDDESFSEITRAWFRKVGERLGPLLHV